MNRTLRMAVFNLVLGTLPVLDVVAFVLHDPVDAARRSVLAVVVEATSELLKDQMATREGGSE
jgi:hypothetical protein